MQFKRSIFYQNDWFLFQMENYSFLSCLVHTLVLLATFRE